MIAGARQAGTRVIRESQKGRLLKLFCDPEGRAVWLISRTNAIQNEHDDSRFPYIIHIKYPGNFHGWTYLWPAPKYFFFYKGTFSHGEDAFMGSLCEWTLYIFLTSVSLFSFLPSFFPFFLPSLLPSSLSLSSLPFSFPLWLPPSLPSSFHPFFFSSKLGVETQYPAQTIEVQA